MKKTYSIRIAITMIGTIDVRADNKEMAEKIVCNKKISASKLKEFREDWIEIVEMKEIDG